MRIFILSLFILAISFPMLYSGTFFKTTENLDDEINQNINSENPKTEIYTLLNTKPELSNLGKNIKNLYHDNKYLPLWNNENRSIMITILKNIYYDGLNSLNPQYHLLDIKSTSNTFLQDILLSDAFVTLATHHYYGLDYHPQKRDINSTALLRNALNKSTIEKSLNQLKPKHHAYLQLQKYLYNTLEINSTTYKKIQLNMERWRWFSKKTATDYIIVNIPQFRLKVIQNNHQVLNMRVVVGKEEYKTPIIDSFLEDMILNPYWYTSNTYNKKILLPALQKNADALSWRKIKLFDANNLTKGATLNPHTINWENSDIKNYVFRQDPGNFNPMGEVKFTFKNPYNIYLHDTNHRELFTKENRKLSTGCIRVEKPKMLAIYLFSREGTNYSYHDINLELQKGTPRHYKLKHGLPIFITYQTVIIKDSTLQFLEDVYQYDDTLQDKIGDKL